MDEAKRAQARIEQCDMVNPVVCKCMAACVLYIKSYVSKSTVRFQCTVLEA
jgi:hypothetical protein